MKLNSRQLGYTGLGISFLVAVIGYLAYATFGTTDTTSNLNNAAVGKGSDQLEESEVAEKMIPPTQVTSEQTFIEQMIPHHQEAIATARIVIARGANTPQIKMLAETIIEIQTEEVVDMKRWYKEWYGIPYKESATYVPMMRDLNGLSGVELDKAFLTDMVEHHLSAIMMAQAVAPYLSRIETDTLARSIAANQSDEIVTMKTILNQL